MARRGDGPRRPSHVVDVVVGLGVLDRLQVRRNAQARVDLDEFVDHPLDEVVALLDAPGAGDEHVDVGEAAVAGLAHPHRVEVDDAGAPVTVEHRRNRGYGRSILAEEVNKIISESLYNYIKDNKNYEIGRASCRERV